MEWNSFYRGTPARRARRATTGQARRTASRIALTDEQKEWAIFWNQLADLRNELHHHGMKKKPVRYDPPELKKVKEFWVKLKDLQLAGS